MVETNTLYFLLFGRSSPGGTTTASINTQRELLLSQLKDMESKADIINTDLAQVGMDNYRPHTEYDGKVMFSVCLSTGGGSPPTGGGAPGVPPQLGGAPPVVPPQLGGGAPGGTPPTGGGGAPGGTPPPQLGGGGAPGGTPPPTGEGVPPGVPPQLGQGAPPGVPPPNWGAPPGVPPPFQQKNGQKNGQKKDKVIGQKMDKILDTKLDKHFGHKIGQTFWKLLEVGGRGRYASCGHAGGLSCC